MFRQIPLRAMRLLLAITYLRVALVTALPIEGSGSDLSPRSPDSESRPEILDITVVYCNPHYEPDPQKNGQGRFLKLINVKEIRLAEIKAREKSEGRGKEEKVEGEKSERGMKKLKERQSTNYADVSPALCLGMKACYFYQKDSNGDPKIGNLAPYIHKARFSLSNEKPSFQISYLYHKSMLVSLILNGSQSEISKEDLFDTFSTFEKLQSALNKQKIHFTISDDKSLLSAMLQFMDRMKVLRGYYDKDQTLEQNMASKGKPVWTTLKFLSPSNNLQTSPDIRSLCFDFWGMCLVGTVTNPNVQENFTGYKFKLNLRLDNLYVEYRIGVAPRCARQSPTLEDHNDVEDIYTWISPYPSQKDTVPSDCALSQDINCCHHDR
ncbi:hypothetical protein FB446DRAFT_704506 [Lentinula raphanica]|nr:hypothetical protein FB446DRAFT_704506 [Lentinula raphanica]